MLSLVEERIRDTVNLDFPGHLVRLVPVIQSIGKRHQLFHQVDLLLEGAHTIQMFSVSPDPLRQRRWRWFGRR